MARLRAYLVRATYEWIAEHGLTPHFLIDAEQDQVEVPWEFVEEGRIILNASPVAIRNLQLEDDFVGFEASFSGQIQEIFIPMSALLAVYAVESGQGLYAHENSLGMLVNEGESEDELDPQPEDENKDSHPSSKKSSFLKIVK